MKSYTIVSRKTVEDDRIAICPKFGCENLTRVKPLKLGFLGFGKYPKCREHQIPLVYVDERIGDFVTAALSCLFDISGLPPQNLLSSIKKEIPEEVESFIKKWIYCITTGRGAPIISQYMDSISNSYFKQLSKKQLKFLKNENKSKKTEISLAIKNGIQEITDQYTRLLKHLRIHHEVFNEPKALKPLSNRSKKILSGWLESSKKANKVLLSIESKQDIPLSETKKYYDSILNMGICMCLLGYSTKKRENMTKKISAFDRFNAYFEFYSNGLTQKFIKTDIKELLQNFTKHTSPILDIRDEKFYALGKNLSSNILGHKTDTYDTLDLIENLRNEIQLFSEELVLLFPNRLVIKKGNKYSHQSLSQLWGRNEKYVSSYVIKKANEDSDFIIKGKAFLELKKKIEEKLGVKAQGCFQLIRRYQNNVINTLEFVDLLEKELGRVSGEIKLTDEELSMILVGTHRFINNIFNRMTISSHRTYNPHYKFSKERLNEFRASILEIFGYRAKKCINLINKYESLNTDLKDYPYQQYTIKRPNYFQHIDKHPDKSYWFGFMRADATRGEKSQRITIELALKDKEHLEKFAKAVGFPIERIKVRTHYNWYKGQLKTYKSAILRFVCKPMASQLAMLGFVTKGELKSVPDYVLHALGKAKEKAKQTKTYWWLTLPGMVALSFLLGFYDGDGTYKGGRSAGIYAKSKEFLEHIKKLFEIKNKIVVSKKPGEAWVFDQRYISKGVYSLSLGPKLFDMMINSYEESMKRKKP